MGQHMTVTESVEAYLAVKATKSEAYERDLGLTLRAVTRNVGNIQMRHLEMEHISKMFDSLAKVNAPGTFNKKHGQVQQWLRHAHRRRQLRRSPDELMSGVERRRVVPRSRLYLSAGELLGVLEAATHPRDRVYLALAMNTALRAGEIISLRLEDLDLDKLTLAVLRHKTGTRDVMPVTADLERELRRWLIFYTDKVGVLEPHFYLAPAKARPVLGPGGADPDPLGSRLRPTDRMQRNHQLMHRLLSAAGFPTEREGLHTIRRSVSRLAYDYYLSQGEARDEALSVVQSTLGHSTQAITEKYIGTERHREKRDLVLRGKPFLSAMLPEQDNVRRIHG